MDAPLCNVDTPGTDGASFLTDEFWLKVDREGAYAVACLPAHQIHCKVNDMHRIRRRASRDYAAEQYASRGDAHATMYPVYWAPI